MKILALETSAKSVSVAVTEDGVPLASSYQNTGLTHSRTPMPLLDAMLTSSGLELQDMDALAVGLDENTEFEQLDARIRQMLQEVSAALEKRIAQFGLDSKIQQIAKMTQNTSVREWKRAVKDTLGIQQHFHRQHEASSHQESAM